MKNLALLLLLLSFFGCKSENEQIQTLTDGEWRDILKSTLTLAEGSKPYVFKKYENIGLKDIISSIYINCTDLGYEFNDSILNIINNRINRPIKNKLDTMFNVKFISDTNGIIYNYVMYSEPLYLNNEILCISMINRKVKENTSLRWVFFMKKQNGSLKIIEFYDDKKEKYFRPAPS